MKRSRRPPLRALASTVLRSSAVSENSAATNTALPKMSATMANTLTRVAVTFTITGIHMLAKTSGTPGYDWPSHACNWLWWLRRSPARGQRMSLGEPRRRLHADDGPLMQFGQGRGTDVGAGAAHARGDVVEQILDATSVG